MKPGIVVVAELTGPAAERIHAIQERFDPRLAAELPPHITIVGSSGMGPIAADTPLDELRARLEPITTDAPPIEVRFHTPHRFMQTDLVVLPIDPNGPLRDLHERIRRSGLRYGQPRFTFTPHCTLNFYRELPRTELKDLLRERVDEAVRIDRLDCYRTINPTTTERILELPLRKQDTGNRRQ